MKRQITERVGGAIVTDYVEVVHPRNAQPPRRRAVVVSKMSNRDLFRWRRQAWLAEYLRSAEDTELLARAERLAKSKAKAKDSILGFLPEDELV